MREKYSGQQVQIIKGIQKKMPGAFMKKFQTAQTRRVPPRPGKLGRRDEISLYSTYALPVISPGNSSPAYQLSPTYRQSNHIPYFNQCFDCISVLGEGSYGIVFRALSKDDGRWYAVKKFKDRFRSSVHRNIKLTEVHRYEQVPKNTFCVEFIRAWEEDGYLFIQMELCSVSLNQYVEYHSIQEEHLWNILLDLLLAVGHLHSHNFIHLDIKPENILVSPHRVFKLGDFGLMLDLSKGPVTDAQEGDSRYLAPEVLSGVYTKAADIFSLGISILEIAANIELPPSGPLWHELRAGYLPRDELHHMSDELYEIIRLMMSPEQAGRPQVDELLLNKRLIKLQRSRILRTLACEMVTTLKSWYRYSVNILLNYGLGIYKSFKFTKHLRNNNEYTIAEGVQDMLTITPELTPERDNSLLACENSSPCSSRRTQSTSPSSRELSACKKRIFEDDSRDEADSSTTPDERSRWRTEARKRITPKRIRLD